MHNCPWCLQLSLKDVCGSLVLLASAWVVHEDRMMRFTLSAASAVVIADQFPRFLEDGCRFTSRTSICGTCWRT